MFKWACSNLFVTAFNRKTLRRRVTYLNFVTSAVLNSHIPVLPLICSMLKDEICR